MKKTIIILIITAALTSLFVNTVFENPGNDSREIILAALIAGCDPTSEYKKLIEKAPLNIDNHYQYIRSYFENRRTSRRDSG